MGAQQAANNIRSNQMNPNSKAFAAARDNRANQMNPNSPNYAGNAIKQRINPVHANPVAAKVQLSPPQAKKPADVIGHAARHGSSAQRMDAGQTVRCGGVLPDLPCTWLLLVRMLRPGRFIQESM